MTTTEVSVSAERNHQAFSHGLKKVEATIYSDVGDGWVINGWHNRHLSGSITQFRENVPGQRTSHRREYLPLDSVMLQARLIGRSSTKQLVRIGGGEAESGEYEPGEIDRLTEYRYLLGGWVTLSEAEIEEVKQFFGEVAVPRVNATNPLNWSAGERAARMQTLQDRTGRVNIGAVRAMTFPLEADLTARFWQLARDVLPTNDERTRRWQGLIFDESRFLARADGLLAELIAHQDKRVLADLRGVVHQLHFRFKPFNQLEHGLRQAGSTFDINDPAVLETTQEGLRLERAYNYFVQPFRRITAPAQKDLKEILRQPDCTLLADVTERLAALETMAVSGPYAVLVGRLLPLAQEVEAALRNHKVQQANQAARKLRWLLTYHCLPKDDPQAETWYRYQL